MKSVCLGLIATALAATACGDDGGAATDARGVVLTVDGQWAHSFLPGDTVEVTEAEVPLRLLPSTRTYFDIMRDKLHWGVRGGA